MAGPSDKQLRYVRVLLRDLGLIPEDVGLALDYLGNGVTKANCSRFIDQLKDNPARTVDILLERAASWQRGGRINAEQARRNLADTADTDGLPSDDAIDRRHDREVERSWEESERQLDNRHAA